MPAYVAWARKPGNIRVTMPINAQNSRCAHLNLLDYRFFPPNIVQRGEPASRYLHCYQPCISLYLLRGRNKATYISLCRLCFWGPWSCSDLPNWYLAIYSFFSCIRRSWNHGITYGRTRDVTVQWFKDEFGGETCKLFPAESRPTDSDATPAVFGSSRQRDTVNDEQAIVGIGCSFSLLLSKVKYYHQKC